MTPLPPLSPGKFRGLTRMADAGGRFRMLAVDQRPPIRKRVAEARGEETARAADIRAVKRALMEALAPHASAVLADPTHALMDALVILGPEPGLIVTLEDSLFADTGGGRLSKEIDHWSVSKIRRIGGDAVKVLCWFRPDQDERSLQNQRDFAQRVGEECARLDIPYLLEMLVYPLAGEEGQTADYVEQPGKRADHVLQSVVEFAQPDYGVDVFKLESPVPAADVGAEPERETQELFNEMGRHAGRPWVMLSAGATKDAFRNVLRCAYRAGASGYLAGRAIWWDEFAAFPDLDAVKAGLEGPSADYMRELNQMTQDRARPWRNWYQQPRPAHFDSETFPFEYPDLEGRL